MESTYNVTGMSNDYFYWNVYGSDGSKIAEWRVWYKRPCTMMKDLRFLGHA